MIERYDDMIAFRLFGIPVNWTIASTWIVMALLVFVSVLATRGLKTGMKVSRWQTGMEVVVGLMRSQIKEMAGDDPMKYLPLVGTFFLFIAACVLLSVIPWFKIPTASLSTTGAFAAVVLAGIPFYGIRNAGVRGYLKKYTEPSLILMPINVISDISSTVAMAIRLFGNMLSGVLIGSILLMLVPFVLPLPMQLLGLFTGFIQSYIFAVLAVVFMSSVVPPADEEGFVETPAAEKELREGEIPSFRKDFKTKGE